MDFSGHVKTIQGLQPGEYPNITALLSLTSRVRYSSFYQLKTLTQ